MLETEILKGGDTQHDGRDDEPIVFANGAKVDFLLPEATQNPGISLTSVDLLFTGSDVEDLYLLVEFWATIGPITKKISEFDLVVPKNAVFSQSIDIRAAATIHPIQKDYPIRIDGRARIVDDRELNAYQSLKSIYLVNPQPDGGFEFVLSGSDYIMMFPGCFTSAEKEAEALQAMRLLANEGELITGVGSGLYTFEPHD